ncbi:MAG: hypothetical protein V1735_01960 [Nanoarchaeota archaeon]
MAWSKPWPRQAFASNSMSWPFSSLTMGISGKIGLMAGSAEFMLSAVMMPGPFAFSVMLTWHLAHPAPSQVHSEGRV